MTYKRMAEIRHAVGHKFTGRGIAPLQARFSEVECILERNRPHGAISRGDCVYMRDNEDFSAVGIPYDTGYIHDVEPIGGVERRDIYWIGVLQKRRFKDARVRGDIEPALSDDQVAMNYWAGKSSARPIWEWVAPSAEVVGSADVATQVKPNSPLLDAIVKAAGSAE